RSSPGASSLFKEIATSNSSARIRREACSAIDDDALLARISRGDPDADVRFTAVQRIRTWVGPAPDVLLAIAEVWRSDTDPRVRAAALDGLARALKLPEALAGDRALQRALGHRRAQLSRESTEYHFLPIVAGGYDGDSGLFGSLGLRFNETYWNDDFRAKRS